MAAPKGKPWDRDNPTPASRRTKLTPASKAAAKAAAERAGRTYPNLVDNMRAARAQKNAGKSQKNAGE